MRLIPTPKRFEKRSGSLVLQGHATLTGIPVAAAGGIKQLLKESGIPKVVVREAGRISLSIGKTGTDALPPEHAEGYCLEVSAGGVAAVAADPAGLYYAVQTLAQMARADQGRLPAGVVEDWPDYPIRAYQDDISRKQVSTLDDFRRILRILGSLKINCYSPYIEDMLYLKSHPDIGEGRGRLTPSEVAGILKTAADHHIKVLPVFCLLGHCENLLAMPAYCHLARRVPFLPSSFDVRNPQLKPFLRKVIRDVCELFPGGVLHGGFDEVRGLTREEFVGHVTWVASELRRHGKRLAIYDDMFINHFGYEAHKGLPEDVILVNWNYGAFDSFPGERELADSGREHWVCTGVNSWCRFSADYPEAAGNIRNFLRQGRSTGAVGAVLTQWGDDGYENQRDAVWSLIAYFAENAWAGEVDDDRAFFDAFNIFFYGGKLPGLTKLAYAMSDLKLGAYDSWNLAHANPYSMERAAVVAPRLLSDARRAAKLAKSWRRTLEKARAAAKRERNHLDHWTLGLSRIEDLAERVIATGVMAERRARGARIADLAVHCARTMGKVASLYKRLWLRHNKKENSEVSLRRFADIARDYRRFYREDAPRKNELPLDLSPHLNEAPLEISGTPSGVRRLAGVTFRTEPLGDFAVGLTAGKGVDIPFPGGVLVQDLHLLLAGSYIPMEEAPALKVELLDHDGTVVFAEELFGCRHLADWYAPLGDIWAGSGMLFVDRSRVDLAWKGIAPGGGHYGVYRLHGFQVPDGRLSASLRLTALGQEKAMAHLLAVTVERGVGRHHQRTGAS